MAKKSKKKQDDLLREWDSPIELMLRNAIVEFVDHEKKWKLVDYSTSKEQASTYETPLGIDVIPMDEDRVHPMRLAYGLTRENLKAPVDTSRIAWLYGSVRAWSYKIDLLIQCRHQNLAIECDGHEWHDRTKQQASSDRARDRFLLSKGIHTIRFTGSDIHRDANECAVEIMALLEGLVRVDDETRQLGDQAGRYAAARNIERQLSTSIFQAPEEHW